MRLLREVDRPDMLPLLQLALNRLFDSRVASIDGAMLTVAAYQSLGGLAGIVDREAERAMSGLDEAEIGRLLRLFRQLAGIGEFDGGEADTRPANLTIRTVPLSEAVPDAPSNRLVAALIDARILLTSGQSAAAGIRLAHQRVLTDWIRARELVTASIRFFRIRQEVEDQRRRWNDAGRSHDLLIQSGRSLARAESIVEQFGDELSPATREFVFASVRRARRRRRLTAVAALLITLLPVSLGSGIFAWHEEQRTEHGLHAAKNAVRVIGVDIARGLRNEGVRTAIIRYILERTQENIEWLVRFDPDDLEVQQLYLEWLEESAATYQKAGDIRGARAAATTALSRGRAIVDRRRDDPVWQRDVSVTLNRLGSIALISSESAEALKAHEEALGIMRRLSERDPTNATWQRDLSISLSGIADAKSQIGDARGALAAYDEGLAIIRSLSQRDHTNLELQREIAVRLNDIGGVKLSTGDAAAAAADYNEGLAIARTLVEQNPRNTQRQQDVFFSLIKIGDFKAQTGDKRAAAVPYTEAVEIARHLARLDTDNPSLHLGVAQGLFKLGDVKLIDVAEGLSELGDVELDIADVDARARLYEEALAILRGLAQRYPDNSRWQRELSVSLNKVGDVKLQKSDAVAALPLYSEALTIVGRDPENLGLVRDVALTLSNIGHVELRTGDATGAVANYEQALTRLRPLSEHDPNNTLWLRDLSVTLNQLGDGELRTGDTGAAAASYDESLAIARRLAARDPANAQWQRDLWFTLNKLGDAQSHIGDTRAAAASLEESLAVARRLADGDPGNELRQSDLWIALYKLSENTLSRGDTTAARSLCEEGLTIIRALAASSPTNVQRQLQLVMTLYRLASMQDGSERERALKEALDILEGLEKEKKLPPNQIGWPDLIRQVLTIKH